MFDWLVKLDHQINHYIFRGNKGETISSRMGRKIDRKNCIACKFLCRIVLAPLAWVLGQGSHHCKKSIQEEFKDVDKKD